MTSPTSFRVFADDQSQRFPGIWRVLFQVAYGLTYAAQVAHWHISSPRFNDLHEFFNDEYDLWFKNVDTIAEHIRQHPEDNLLPFSLPALAEGLKTFEATTDADALTKNYLQYLLAFESLVAKGDKAFEHPADIDLLGELSRVVEKSKWKTESILKVKQ